MPLNMKTVASYFFRIEDLDTQANLCERYFYPESIRNDNGAVAMSFFLCDTNGTNKFTNKKRTP